MAVAAIDAIKSRSMVACRLAKVYISQQIIAKILRGKRRILRKIGGFLAFRSCPTLPGKGH